MLNKLRLLLNSGELLGALKASCSDLQISDCWLNENMKTIHVSANYQGRRLNAWGSDKNESVALAKSLVELTERIHLRLPPQTWQNMGTGKTKNHDQLLSESPILSSFMQTSSGMAAHFSKTEAQTNSLNEIIERHVITRAMLQGIRARAISNNVFLWNGPLHTHVALIRHDTGSNKFIYGTAASKNASAAVEAAKREISALIPWSHNSANINHLIKTAVANRPSEIQAYHLSEPHKIFVLDSMSLSTPPDQSGIKSDDVWFADIAPVEAFKILNLKLTRAFSPKMQPLFFGKLSDGPINPLAIDLDQLNIQADYNVVA